MQDEIDVDFNYEYQRQYVLFAGTEVMQGKVKAGNHIKAVVIRTGEALFQRCPIRNKGHTELGYHMHK